MSFLDLLVCLFCILGAGFINYIQGYKNGRESVFIEMRDTMGGEISKDINTKFPNTGGSSRAKDRITLYASGHVNGEKFTCEADFDSNYNFLEYRSTLTNERKN